MIRSKIVRLSYNLASLFTSVFILLSFTDLAIGTTQGITYQGRILDQNRQPLSKPTVNFYLKITNSDGSCILYAERDSVDMSSGDGTFGIIMGNGARTDGNSVGLEKIFSSSLKLDPSNTCPKGFTKTDSERIMLNVFFDDGTGFQTLNPIEITPAPYAMDSLNVAGEASENVLRLKDGPAAPMTSVDFTKLLALVNGTSNQYAQSSAGSGALVEADLPTVVTPGKVSGSSITNGMIGGTTSILTSGLISTTGNLSAGGISSNSLSTRTFDIFNSSNSKISLLAPSPAFTNYNLTLPTSAGTNGQVLSSDGSGNLVWQTPSAGGGGGGGGSGSVTSVASGTGLTGGPITTTGTISLADTAITPGTYGSSVQFPYFTVDQQGRLTAAGQNSISSFQGTTASTFAAGNDSRITGALQTTGGTLTGNLNLKAGTTTVSSLTIPSGALLTTPASGNIENDGNAFYWTNGSAQRRTLANYSGTPSNGQIMIGNGSDFSLGTITAGTGISVTNSAGGISISANNSGAVTSITATGTAGNPIVVGGTAAAPTIGLPAASGVANGYLSSADWTTFNGKLSAVAGATLTNGSIWVGNGSGQAVAVAPSADVSMTNAGAFTVAKLQNRTLASTAPSLGSVMKWNNTLSQWEPSVYASCLGASQVMHYNSITDVWSCDTVSVTSATGTLSLSNGGTGASDQSGAANAILPSQASNAGKVLTTDGTNVSWGAASSSQWNNGASSSINYTAGNVGIGTTSPSGQIHIHSSSSGKKSLVLTGLDYNHSGDGLGGVALTMGFNDTNWGSQLWIGEKDFFGDVSKPIFRMGNGGPSSIPANVAFLDAVTGDGSAHADFHLGGNARLQIGGTPTSYASNIGVQVRGFNSAYTTLDIQAAPLQTANYFSVSQSTSGDKFVINGSGNVGIGTTSPSTPLEVNGNTKINNTLTTSATELVLEQTGDTYGTTRLRLRNRSGSGGAIFEGTSNDLVDFGFLPSSGASNQSNLRLEHRGAYLANSSNTAGEFHLINTGSGASTPWFASGPAATIIETGNVGIGTASPGALLDVKGAIRMSGSTSGYTGFQPAAAAGSTVWTLPAADGSNGQVLTTNGTGILSWSTPSGGVSSQWTTTGSDIYYNTGNVGIGTNSPAAKLDVADVNNGLMLRAGNDSGSTGRSQITMGWNGNTSYSHRISTRHNSGISGNAVDFYLNDNFTSGGILYGGFDSDYGLYGYRKDSVSGGITNTMSVIHDASGAGSGIGAGLMFKVSTLGAWARDSGQIASIWTDAVDASRTSALTFSTVNNAGTLTEAVRISGNGNVGIGATSPSKPLEIDGADNDYQLFLTNKSGWAAGKSVGITFGDTTGGSSLSVPYSSNGLWSTYFGLAFKTTNSNVPLTVGTGGTTDVGLGGNINTSSLSGASMVVKGTGKVGIGSTSPVSSLDLSSKTDGINLPKGTTAQQLACGATTEGNFRYNSDNKLLEYCDGSSWNSLPKVQPAAPPSVPSGSGYFVLTATTWNGYLGGRTGADAKCLTELTATHTDWAGYTDANSRGLLTAAKVKAFLCDGGACSNLTPLATYLFAAAGQPSTGGASFTADASGVGPNDSAIWSAANRFGGAASYWLGRGSATGTTWSNSPGGSHCSGFTDSSGGNSGRTGDSGYSDATRWYSPSVPSCDQNLALICVVNP